MKTRKIFLLAVVLALVLSFAACSNDVEQEINVSPAPDCFVVEEAVTFTSVSQLDGKVIASNSKYNLVALQKNELSATGGMQAMIKVYDLKTQKVVYENNGISLSGIESLAVSLDNYPVISMETKAHVTNEDGVTGLETKNSYYLVDTKTGLNSPLATDIEGVIETAQVGNMYLYAIEDTLYWVSKTGKIVRTDVLGISDTYTDLSNIADYYNVDAEYNGFLYTWEVNQLNQRVLVYDTEGVCIVEYNFPNGIVFTASGANDHYYDESVINPRCFVLNDGNILVQYCIEADENATSWDIVYADMRLDVHSAIVNYRTGEVTEKELNYIVSELESKYYRGTDDRGSGFTLELASGYDNQAYVVAFANGYLGDRVDYVVLDNALETKYTFANDYFANSGYYYIFDKYYGKNYYVATVYLNGELTSCVFDHEGALVCVLPTNAIDTDFTYYGTISGIYTMSGELKYDFEANGFTSSIITGEEPIYDMYNGNVYLCKFNFTTGGEEVYVLDLDTFETKRIADGIDVQISVKGDAYVKVYNEDTDVSTLYNSNNEVILKVRGQMRLEECEDVLYVTAKVGTDDLVYVINETAPTNTQA